MCIICMIDGEQILEASLKLYFNKVLMRMIDSEMWLVIRRQATFWVLYIIIQMCANSLLVLTI